MCKHKVTMLYLYHYKTVGNRMNNCSQIAPIVVALLLVLRILI
jgi:hypothetical protein